MRALASHRCLPGSILGPGVICGLSLLLVLYSAPRGFSPGTLIFPSPQKPTFPYSNLISGMHGHFLSSCELLGLTNYIFTYFRCGLLKLPFAVPTLLLISLLITINPIASSANDISFILVASKLDFQSCYPSQNVGLPRWYRTTACFPPCLKAQVGVIWLSSLFVQATSYYWQVMSA